MTLQFIQLLLYSPSLGCENNESFRFVMLDRFWMDCDYILDRYNVMTFDSYLHWMWPGCVKSYELTLTCRAQLTHTMRMNEWISLSVVASRLNNPNPIPTCDLRGSFFQSSKELVPLWNWFFLPRISSLSVETEKPVPNWALMPNLLW